MTPLHFPAELPRSGDVVLRPFEDADIDMLCDLATDPYLPLIGSLPADASRQQADDFMSRQHLRLESGSGYSFCVADATGKALGTAGLWIADLHAGRATIGYSVAPFARRRGVAARALRALTEFAWTLPGLFRIELYIEPWNLGSSGWLKAMVTCGKDCSLATKRSGTGGQTCSCTRPCESRLVGVVWVAGSEDPRPRAAPLF